MLEGRTTGGSTGRRRPQSPGAALRRTWQFSTIPLVPHPSSVPIAFRPVNELNTLYPGLDRFIRPFIAIFSTQNRAARIVLKTDPTPQTKRGHLGK